MAAQALRWYPRVSDRGAETEDLPPAARPTWPGGRRDPSPRLLDLPNVPAAWTSTTCIVPTTPTAAAPLPVDEPVVEGMIEQRKATLADLVVMALER